MQDKQETKYSTFIETVEYYDKIVNERSEIWTKIKENVRQNPNTAWEVDEKHNTLTYLIIRNQQEEPLYAIEHKLLELEIRSLNLLNQLCELADEKSMMEDLLKVTYSSEIAYYQTKEEDLTKLYEDEKEIYRHSTPSYDTLKRFNVSEYIE